MEKRYWITGVAVNRLREAWKSGEMELITMTWSKYFEMKENKQ